MADHVDELFALPLDQFTTARNELARQLRDQGHKEAAKEVSALRKPTLAAWAVNQLAKRSPDELSQLMSLRNALDSSDASTLRVVTDRRRKLVAALAKTARAIVEESGRSVARSTIEGITNTLLAGALEKERAAILAGRLTHELEPAGFEGLAAPVVAMPQQQEEDEAHSLAARRAEDLATKAKEAELAAERLANQAEVARGEADSLEKQAQVARARAERAREEADQALGALPKAKSTSS